MSLEPGRLFILNFLEQEGQLISVLGVFIFSKNFSSQDPHCNFAGLLSTPAISTFPQPIQVTFSVFQSALVAGSSTFTLAEHNSQLISPNILGKSPSHFGHLIAGNSIDDSISSTLTTHLLITYEVLKLQKVLLV